MRNLGRFPTIMPLLARRMKQLKRRASVFPVRVQYAVMATRDPFTMRLAGLENSMKGTYGASPEETSHSRHIRHHFYVGCK